MPKPPTKTSEAWALAAQGTQLAITVLLGLAAGYGVDQRWKVSPWGLLGGGALGLALGLYAFLAPFFRR